MGAVTLASIAPRKAAAKQILKNTREYVLNDIHESHLLSAGKGTRKHFDNKVFTDSMLVSDHFPSTTITATV